ncbi:uncharacterized protein EI90DRAFT_3023991 [Cantharellus anzutake]|uniref:uncharacterized protein n=1 Tax=Cantharellus anzutake TaxID=1750568 RepID=UPI001907E091|nr:uncharacterized protein EI90DRAFT_3023991 [Cantharellus anzutake]KAF8310923.1 hypothetical protein EI90DRAFT_3023991 [Cantharellus anzutake]
MSCATPQPECIKLKPKELRPPGLSISLSSNVDPEPMRMPIVATPTQAVVFDMRVEFKFKELRPPSPSFGFPTSDDNSEPEHELHDAAARDKPSPVHNSAEHKLEELRPPGLSNESIGFRA